MLTCGGDATALTPGAGGGGGSDRHGDGEDSSLPPRGSSFWFTAESFVRRNPRRSSAAAFVAVGGAASFAYSNSKAGVARQIRKVFEDGGLCGWEMHFRKDWLPNCIHRPDLLKDITHILRPGANPQYSVIVGAAGTGMSTERPPGLCIALTPSSRLQASQRLSEKQ